MLLTGYVLEQLAVMRYTDGIDTSATQQAVVVSSTSSHAIALSVKGNTWHNDSL